MHGVIPDSGNKTFDTAKGVEGLFYAIKRRLRYKKPLKNVKNGLKIVK
mgnify:FL=1